MEDKLQKLLDSTKDDSEAIKVVKDTIDNENKHINRIIKLRYE